MNEVNTVNSLNRAIAEIRRLKANKSNQEEGLANRASTALAMVESQHGDAKQDLMKFANELSKIRAELVSGLQIANLALADDSDETDIGETADIPTLLGDARQRAAKFSNLLLELDQFRKLRDEWLLALASFSNACYSAQANLEKIRNAHEIAKVVRDLSLSENAFSRAARAFSGNPSELEGYETAIERYKTIIVAADCRLAKIKSARRIKQIAVSALLFLIALIGIHYVLLMNTVLVVSVLPSESAPFSEGEITASWNGKPFKTVERGSDVEIPLRLNIRELGDGELTLTSPAYDSASREVKIFYGVNDIGVIKMARSTGSLSIKTDLPDALIVVARQDGVIVQNKYESESINLPSGSYVVSATNGLARASQQVRIDRGKHFDVFVSVPRGNIELSATPVGSVFTLENASKTLVRNGSLPTTLRGVSLGKYTVTFQFGDELSTKQIEVLAGKTTSCIDVFPYGAIKITSDKPERKVTYKLVRNGKIESAGSLPVAFISSKAGYVDIEATDKISTLSKRVFIETDHKTLVAFNFPYDVASADTYLDALDNARAALNSAEFSKADEFVANALAVIPGDEAATKLRNEIANSKARAERLRIEAGRQEVIDIIEKAIRAEGGREAIERFRSNQAAWRGTGNMQDTNYSINFTVYLDLPDKIRLDQEVYVQPKETTVFGILKIQTAVNPGKPQRVNTCLNGVESWQWVQNSFGETSLSDSLSPNPKRQLSAALHNAECLTLEPLLGNDFILTKLLDYPLMSDRYLAIKVQKSGYSDVVLIFDKDTGLISGIDSESINNKGVVIQGRERYGEFRNYQGLKQPTSSTFSGSDGSFNTMTLVSIFPMRQNNGNVFSRPRH